MEGQPYRRFSTVGRSEPLDLALSLDLDLPLSLNLALTLDLDPDLDLDLALLDGPRSPIVAGPPPRLRRRERRCAVVRDLSALHGLAPARRGDRDAPALGRSAMEGAGVLHAGAGAIAVPDLLRRWGADLVRGGHGRTGKPRASVGHRVGLSVCAAVARSRAPGGRSAGAVRRAPLLVAVVADRVLQLPRRAAGAP